MPKPPRASALSSGWAKRTATQERLWWILPAAWGAELDELKALITAGVGTFVCMHMDADIVKALQEDNRCNVLCMGHMASDSIGFNQILDAWEARGVEVTRIGGLV